jgi:hypothetical protein
MCHQHRQGGAAQHLLGDAAKDPFPPPPMAIGAHDEQRAGLGRGLAAAGAAILEASTLRPDSVRYSAIAASEVSSSSLSATESRLTLVGLSKEGCCRSHGTDRLHPVLPGDDHRLTKRAGGPIGDDKHRPPGLERNRVAYPCPELVVLLADARQTRSNRRRGRGRS